ncbi:MAG: cupin domain-containing protein [Chloroflexota bacterium]
MAVDLESTPELGQFYKDVQRHHMTPLWTAAGIWNPVHRAIPYLWHRDEYWPLCQRSGELVPIERGGERRVLAFLNPGLPPEMYGATHTLWVAVQYLQPGEIAPAHRHSAGAIRFILQGDKAFTNVNGDKCIMQRGDLVLTPAWVWHDHGHEGKEPMIWMDGLDLPFARGLGMVFFEPYPQNRQPVLGENLTEKRHHIGQLRPALAEADPSGTSPLMNYKWAQAEEALHALSPEDASPYDDLALEYINPLTGGSVLPTMSCWIQRLRPGVHTKPRRQMTSKVFHVFEGHGRSIIDGQRFDWRKGDFFCVPTWSRHEHENDSSADAVLFSVQDTPIFQKLGLYRESDE